MTASFEPKKIRSFLAILLPDDVKSQIYHYTSPLRRLPLDLKWVAKENYHLTLKFFGSLTKSQIDRVNLYLNELAPQVNSFFLNYGGWGLFPNQRHPRVLWVGLGGAALNALQKLWLELENDLSKLGFPKEEKRFHPHITLGRFRSAANIELLFPIMEKSPLAKEMGSFPVADLHLMESKLGPTGPSYASLSAYPLRTKGPS
ncbi:MAG: RNA 2',3'-cyclic phosphodiesterase [Bacillota bacterium]|nr:RNA 2',3'-cyclic phosphodiesterase [Bacillota bacterium]